jgi:hypothetical protein
MVIQVICSPSLAVTNRSLLTESDAWAQQHLAGGVEPVVRRLRLLPPSSGLSPSEDEPRNYLYLCELSAGEVKLLPV